VNIALGATGLTCNTRYYYTAVATSGGSTVRGSESSFTTATCPRPPTILVQPQSVTIKRNRTATLYVSASGSGLRYQWYIGSSGATGSPISGATSASFTTPPLKTTTSYWVRVSNADGSVNSRTATVTVR
jgi:hypothetical protein